MKFYKLIPYTNLDHNDYIKCQIEAYKKYLLEFYGKCDTAVMENHLKILKPDLYKIVVKGQLAGFVYFKEDEKITLDVFTLLPAFRNKGLGSAILKNFIKIAKKAKKEIVLDTFKTNPAKDFYEKHGFKVTGENDTHYILTYTPKK